jgi:hypothetical protein
MGKYPKKYVADERKMVANQDPRRSARILSPDLCHSVSRRMRQICLEVLEPHSKQCQTASNGIQPGVKVRRCCGEPLLAEHLFPQHTNGE